MEKKGRENVKDYPRQEQDAHPKGGEQSKLLEEKRAAVRKAFSELKPEEREMLAMRYAGNMSYKEMAHALDMSVTGVCEKLSRLRYKGEAKTHFRRVVMNCEEIRTKFSYFNDGELAGEEIKAAKDHLRGCSVCQAEERFWQEAGY